MNLVSISILFVLPLLLVFLYFKYSYNYWLKRGVAQIQPYFPFGNLSWVVLRRQNIGERFKEIYDIMKSEGNKYAGLYLFSRKVFLAIDPELVKNILTRHFNHFDDRGIYYDEVNDPLSAHLFSLSGSKWRNLRTKFTSTFTPGKIKYMFDTFTVCGDQMLSMLRKVTEKQRPVEIKDVMARFTTDVIGSCAFGLDCNSMKNPNTEFRKIGRRAFTQTIGDVVKIIIIRSFPWLARWFGLGIFSSKVTSFFRKVVIDTINYREKNRVVRKDFLQLLIQLKQNKQEKSEDEDKTSVDTSLTSNEAAAQAFIFFLAGFETTAATMSFAMFEMAVNESIQNKARLEINEILQKFDNKITYDAVMQMSYLDCVVSETLRKHPPAAAYLRKCTKNYNIPHTNIVIEKGLSVIIPALALQRDPEYYADPDKFDPERFNECNKHKIQDYTYLPFGEGPRICIGQRFALIQIKVGLAVILKNFQFSLNCKTGLPLKMETKGIITTPIGGIWLNLYRIKNC